MTKSKNYWNKHNHRKHTKDYWKKYRKSVKKFLGMDKGTATHRLKKIIMFELAKKAGMGRCHRCKLLITDVSEFSVEHIKPWLWIDIDLFWDIENIAFSHLSCNSAANSNVKECGSYAKYKRGCRCEVCSEEYRKAAKKHRKDRYKRIVAVKKLANLRNNQEVVPYFKKMKKKYGFTEMNQLIEKLKKEKQ